MKKLYGLTEDQNYEAAYTTYMPPWNTKAFAFLLASTVIPTAIALGSLGALGTLLVLFGPDAVSQTLSMLGITTEAVKVLSVLSFMAIVLSVGLNSAFNLPILRFKHYLRQPTSVRRRSKLWFEELRILDYLAAKQINALTTEFNIYMERLENIGVEPGEREQTAHDAICALQESYHDAHASVKIELQGERDGSADANKAVDTLNRLHEATSSGESNTLPERIAADLEASTASWQPGSKPLVHTSKNELTRAQRAVAALRQG